MIVVVLLQHLLILFEKKYSSTALKVLDLGA